MSNTVFESYIRSVYANGSGMEYFDQAGGCPDGGIFGGLDPSTILEDMGPVSFADARSPEDSGSIDDSEERGEAGSAEELGEAGSAEERGFIAEAGPVEEPVKMGSAEDTQKNEEPTIGYIQIGLHITPIVEADPIEATNASDSLVAPIELSILPPAIQPEEVGDMLRQLADA